MKYRGIDSATQEVRDALGKCEVCGEQATALVRDIFEIFPFHEYFATKIEPGGDHRFCEKHEREPQVIQIREGPESIRL